MTSAGEDWVVTIRRQGKIKLIRILARPGPFPLYRFAVVHSDGHQMSMQSFVDGRSNWFASEHGSDTIPVDPGDRAIVDGWIAEQDEIWDADPI